MGGTWPTGEYQNPEILENYDTGDIIAGKYCLNHVLGAGGMGTVWLATNMVLEVDVAIKLLHSDFAGQKEASRRFLDEARATAKLRHPGIVRLHDFGTTSYGHAFMVMEHLNGESLADMLERRERIAPIESVQLLLQVLDALDLAHDHGIVHRDLKPENILIVRKGDSFTCKVVDFGIAKVMRRQESSPALEEARANTGSLRSVSGLTQHGAILGSPQYMAPEQARGSSDVDHRADVWGFTVCLYECVNGGRPFDDVESIDKVLLSVLMDEPRRPDELDDGLWEIIQRGVEKDRDHRWQSASEFGEALAQWLVNNGVNVDASGRGLRSRWLGEASIADQSQPIGALTRVVPTPGPASELAIAPAPKSNRVMIGAAVAAAAVIGLGGLLLASRDTATTDEARAGVVTSDPALPPPPASSPTPAPPPRASSPPPSEPVSSGDPSASASPDPATTAPAPVAPHGQPYRKPKPKPKESAGGLPLPEDADF